MATGNSQICGAASLSDSRAFIDYSVYEIEEDHQSDGDLPQQRKNARRWKRDLQRRGVPYKLDTNIPYMLDIEGKGEYSDAERTKLRGHFHNSSVYIPKFMSRTIESDGNIACDYQGIIVHYAKNDSSEKFYLTGLQGNANDPRLLNDERYVNNLMLENIKGALLLVHNAKLSGWESVGFGNTKDPLKRLALKIVCEELGMPCTETVDMNAARERTLYKGNIEKYMKITLANHENAPLDEPRFSDGIKNTVISDDDLFADAPPPQQPQMH